MSAIERQEQRALHAAAVEEDRALRAATTIAKWMDQRFLDPLLGLVPWVGDLLSAGLGLYPVYLAWRKRAPGSLIARMLLNLSVDLLGGLLPVLGDIWDFFFRAHSRNLALLQARAAGELRPRARDRLVVAGAVVVVILAFAAPVALVVAAIVAASR
jgi:hypothetical protein